MFTVVREVKFKKDLGSTFALLSKRERTVMEPVLTKYMNVFHDYEDNQFKSTDLIEHRIVTGDAKPIRKAPYRVPFSLRGDGKAGQRYAAERRH